ncbi:CoA-binding protein [Dehalobacter sp. DCM]|uniref:CoA-binding protein n=1 Tax=Dehalobacter sp. DCM TaxID=2907827 RepID=UPI0030819626|nr:CoA-binding protein [Dehalobacter sp. DCM]
MYEDSVSEESMLAKKVWAVVGATQNPQKYGYKLYRKLKNRGYTVYPVNPVYPDIDGDVCFPKLSSLPQVPEVINMVISPKKGSEILEEAAKLGVKNIWFQPGTYDDELIALCNKLEIDYVLGCVLISLG